MAIELRSNKLCRRPPTMEEVHRGAAVGSRIYPAEMSDLTPGMLTRHQPSRQSQDSTPNNTLNNTQFNHAVASTMQVHHHFKQGISHLFWHDLASWWGLTGKTRSTGVDVAGTYSSLQNTAFSTRSQQTHLLRSLHWLPVKHRITYKTAALTHKVMATGTSSYLHEMLVKSTPARTLRSSAAPLLSVPRCRTELGRRAYSVARCAYCVQLVTVWH